jgi:hypothetical protein
MLIPSIGSIVTLLAIYLTAFPGVITSNPGGTLSFSADYPRTMTFAPSGSCFRQDAECGIY